MQIPTFEPYTSTRKTDEKDSKMIAKSKAAGNSLQDPQLENLDAKGNLKRQKATGHKKTCHWSEQDMKLAHFPEAHPRRNVVQQRVWQDRSPNSPDIEGFKADWTKYQEGRAG